MKNTRLDENASIYHHIESKSEKEKWNSLSLKGKWEYFKDYYLKYCILIFLILLGIFSVMHTIFSKKDTAFTLAIVNGTMTDIQLDEVTSLLLEPLNIDSKKEELLIDQTLTSSDSSNTSLSLTGEQKFSVYTHSGQYDVLITSEAIFEHYASYGYFMNLEEFLPNDIKESYSNSFLGQTPYGISLKGNEKFESFTQTIDSPVLAILHTSTHTERVVQFLDYFSSK